MPFDLYVVRGLGGVIRWRNLADAERPNVEQVIANYEAGLMPMEGTLTVGPRAARSYRWADIRDIWVEGQP